MSRPQVFQYDTLDDRREIHRLLQLLHPQKAVEWLNRQCTKCKGPHGTGPKAARKMGPRVEEAIRRGGDSHYRLATEIFFDFWVLAMQWGIDMDAAAKELEEMTRRPGAPPSPAAKFPAVHKLVCPSEN
jgi:hypothetical protein